MARDVNGNETPDILATKVRREENLAVLEAMARVKTEGRRYAKAQAAAMRAEAAAAAAKADSIDAKADLDAANDAAAKLIREVRTAHGIPDGGGWDDVTCVIDRTVKAKVAG